MELTPGKQLEGFVVRRVTPVDLMRSVAVELEHERSGACVLHLQNRDTENLFSVTFRTPPPDDTGLPHIMEHSVLAGSENYRGKDPFFALVKSSVASFINAMTASDHTLYPVTSAVRQDLFNLADVYWDAVFHPLLTEHTFHREGHRKELATGSDKQSDLTIKGIVYSEMRGAYSSPDSLLYQVCRRELFPNSIYGRDSGGDPERIPELTYEQYRAFHTRYYHPSNALIFLYGDIPTEDYLAFIGPKLAGYERRPAEPELARQTRWSAPRTVRTTYPSSAAEAGRAYVVLSWIFGDGTDPLEAMALNLLERVLLGNEAAPLKKALIDSKLGEDLALAGSETDILDTVFAVGLKGVDPARANDFVDLVMRVLRDLSRNVSRESIESAAQQAAYHTLAISENFPIRLLFRGSARFAQHRHPLPGLVVAEHLAAVKEKALGDPSWLGRLIDERLVSNPHRLLVVAEADPTFGEKRDGALAARMSTEKGRLSAAELDALVAEAGAFEQAEQAEGAKDALASLPILRVSDLPKRPRLIPTRVEQEGRLAFLDNDVFANGINYLHVSLDLSHVPLELLAHAGVYSECVSKMGAAGSDYVRMAERIAAHTSGVYASVGVSAHAVDPAQIVRTITFSTSFLDGQSAQALAIVEDLLFALDPTDRARLSDVVVQANASLRSSIGLSGDRLARAHAARLLSAESWLSDEVHGLAAMRLFARLSDEARAGGADALDPEIERLKALRAAIGGAGRVWASFTGSERERREVRRRVGEWSARLTPTGSALPVAVPAAEGRVLRAGLAAPMDVAFCSRAAPMPGYRDPRTPLVGVAAQHMSLGYILEEIRFKGAAYGAWLRTDSLHHSLLFGSYRDPSVARTLEVFEGLAGAVKGAEWNQKDFDRTILVCAKDSLKPNRPSEATATALAWHLHGLDDELRGRSYDAMRAATPSRAREALLEILEEAREQASTCVVSSRDKLEAGNRELGARPLSIEEIFP